MSSIIRSLHRCSHRYLHRHSQGLLILLALALVLSGCMAPVSEAVSEVASQSAMLALKRQMQRYETYEKSPEAIYAAVAPSVAQIVTVSLGRGSGILLALNEGEQYVLTNAHVVWPYTTVDVVFANGTELSEIPVVEVDELLDLALLGPVEVDAPAVSIADGADLPLGRELYLIGYPREHESLPQPTISRGILSRQRNWDTLGVTYLQTDALSTGGQSGGALVDDDGSVVGLSGWGSEGYTFSVSMESIWSRIEGMAAGEDVDGLGDRRVPLPNDESYDVERFELFGDLDTVAAVFFNSVPVDWSAEAKSWGDLYLELYDEGGFLYQVVDEYSAGAETVEEIFVEDSTYFLVANQWDTDGSMTELSSLTPFVLYFDEDDYVQVDIGDELRAHLDYPGDRDNYLIELTEGDTIAITFESLSVDPLLFMEPPLDSDYEGVNVSVNNFVLNGLDIPAVYRAPEDGTYALSVSSDGDNYGVYSRRGGYVLRIDEAPDDAVPVLVPLAEEELSGEATDAVEEQVAAEE